jgi:ATP-dependent Clp protease, protease subunit
MTKFPLSPLKPAMRLTGDVNECMADKFWDGLQDILKNNGKDPVFLCLTTAGGEADIGRCIAQDIRYWLKEAKNDVYFLGKTNVYSAGVTIMSAFPKEKRFLSPDCVLLIHERKISKDLKLEGPLDRIEDIANDIISQVKNSTQLEEEGFSALAEGSTLTTKDILARAKREWYVTAQEARKLGLIEGIVG